MKRAILVLTAVSSVECDEAVQSVKNLVHEHENGSGQGALKKSQISLMTIPDSYFYLLFIYLFICKGANLFGAHDISGLTRLWCLSVPPPQKVTYTLPRRIGLMKEGPLHWWVPTENVPTDTPLMFFSCPTDVMCHLTDTPPSLPFRPLWPNSGFFD